MKIVHICLMGIVADGFTYQDNKLPKYHKKNGLDVTMITSRWIYDDKGKLVISDNLDYINDDGVHIIRLNANKNAEYKNRFKRFKQLYSTLESANPDILFIHGVQFLDISVIAKYLNKHKNVVAYVDNHNDYSNSAKNFISKYILHRIIWRHMAKKIDPYVTKFFGVLPSRVDFLIDNYHLPEEKCELLVMGADDEYVETIKNPKVKQSIRKKFGISEDDFVIVTGGKIDAFKLQTLLLMEAVKNIPNKKLKLLVFGSIEPSIKDKVDALCEQDRIQYIGWANEEQSYQYFSIADLVVFPGRHSVYWEQVVAMGKPILCKYWSGTTHVDIGGNVRFLYEDSTLEIQTLIEKIINDEDEIFTKMKDIAISEKKDAFLYSKIAEKSISTK